MIRFANPELLLLAIPLLVLYRKFGFVKGPTGWLRVAFMLLLVLAASMPQINLTTDGTDLVLIVDRSQSMPAGTEEQIENLIRDIQQNLGNGDRVALVTFGTQAYVEHEFSSEAMHSEYTKVVARHGSDLNEAILTALDRRVDVNHPMRILVFSDGEFNGSSPLAAARRCREQGVPVDFRSFPNMHAGDIAVESIGLPQSVSPNEPFQFSVWLTSDRETVAEVSIIRNGQLIAKREHPVRVGSNRVLFRDWISQQGFFKYQAEVRLKDENNGDVSDPVPQNDRAAGVVRVESLQRVLVLNHDGQTDNFTRALVAGQIEFDISTATEHPLTQDALDPYCAVILENVPAGSLGRLKMDRLAQFVEDLGGGLMMTGGRQSFATGGYYRSPLEEILPVHLESKKETRRSRVALVVVLDRSGSMTAPVGNGKMKMDLANIGTAECVRMLSSQDKVSVIAVDSLAHVIQPMVNVDASEAIAQKVLQIQSMGGGIFVYVGLLAAAREMDQAKEYGTRHIILFSDAADSEEPDDYVNLLKVFEKNGITVSVIGLGTPADPDALLLEDIARLGNGRIHFTEDAQDLPRLFAQDALNVTRSTFLMKDEENPNGFDGMFLPDIQSMGEFKPTQFPNIEGYNWTFLREGATIGAISTDENHAPLSAFWNRGLGRVASIMAELDGQYSGQLATWDGYEDFVITHTRWLMGEEEDENLFVGLRQEGQDAVIEVEIDSKMSKSAAKLEPDLLIVPPGNERIDPIRPEFIWTGPTTLQARFRMDQIGTYRTLVRSSEGGMVRGPALTLPYSPEFLPRIDLPSGEVILQEIADKTGGKKRVGVLESLQEPFRASRFVSLVPWLCILALSLLVTEIAGRRMGLWQLMKRQSAVKQINEKPEVVSGQKPARQKPNRTRAKSIRQASEHSAQQQSAPAGSSTSTVEPPKKNKADVFAQAKRRAEKRMR